MSESGIKNLKIVVALLFIGVLIVVASFLGAPESAAHTPPPDPTAQSQTPQTGS